MNEIEYKPTYVAMLETHGFKFWVAQYYNNEKALINKASIDEEFIFDYLTI